MLAAAGDQPKMVRILLDHKASVSSRDKVREGIVVSSCCCTHTCSVHINVYTLYVHVHVHCTCTMWWVMYIVHCT